MKKFLALVLTGAMVVAMPVFAAQSPKASDVGTAIATSTGESVVFTTEMAAEAASANLSAVEYVNNIVATVPGMTDAKPIAQGGHVVINGVKTATKLNLTKPTKAEGQAASNLAASMGGKAIACVGLKPAFQFNALGVNFAVAGVKAGSNIVAFQIVNGQLVPVKVNAVTDNFVDVTLTSAGQLILVELN